MVDARCGNIKEVWLWSELTAEVTKQPVPVMMMAQDGPWAFLPQAGSAGAQHTTGRFGAVPLAQNRQVWCCAPGMRWRVSLHGSAKA